MVLYPVFVQMYLELVYNNHEGEGKAIIHNTCVYPLQYSLPNLLVFNGMF